MIFFGFSISFSSHRTNRLLENVGIGERPGIIGWFASYLQGRSQKTSYQGIKSERMRITGGIN
jgi:hypothetical protein